MLLSVFPSESAARNKHKKRGLKLQAAQYLDKKGESLWVLREACIATKELSERETVRGTLCA